MQVDQTTTFHSFGLQTPILRAIDTLGYQTPTDIQSASIPALLEGKDVLGQAQTGTGKTAAFGLPFLSQLDLSSNSVQLLILTPTRELAIQITEALKTYAQYLFQCRILAIYGGQGYATQLHALREGVHIVVGTPGRLIDHIERGTLKLDSLRFLVLDEADEMLKMGFIDDVETILSKIPAQRQTALFSATMPARIKQIGDRYLQSPIHIKISPKHQSEANIRQRYCVLKSETKMAALLRLLEAEEHEGVIVFASTRRMATLLADKLVAAGYGCEALHGDIAQNQREIVINRFKQGFFDVLIATDVAARGLDVDRVTHVFNYDVPNNAEVYVHRIGRTGRAGRSGDAILFIKPRELFLLRDFERATRGTIEKMTLPSAQTLCEIRKNRFLKKIETQLQSTNSDLSAYAALLKKFQSEQGISWESIAAALAMMAAGKQSIWAKEEWVDTFSESTERPTTRKSRFEKENRHEGRHEGHPDRNRRRTEDKMLAFEIRLGRSHGATPRHIVGAIANEAKINSQHIGNITLHDTYTTLQLSETVASRVESALNSAYLFGQKLTLHKVSSAARHAPRKDKPKRYTH